MSTTLTDAATVVPSEPMVALSARQLREAVSVATRTAEHSLSVVKALAIHAETMVVALSGSPGEFAMRSANEALAAFNEGLLTIEGPNAMESLSALRPRLHFSGMGILESASRKVAEMEKREAERLAAERRVAAREAADIAEGHRLKRLLALAD